MQFGIRKAAREDSAHISSDKGTNRKKARARLGAAALEALEARQLMAASWWTVTVSPTLTVGDTANITTTGSASGTPVNVFANDALSAMNAAGITATVTIGGTSTPISYPSAGTFILTTAGDTGMVRGGTEPSIATFAGLNANQTVLAIEDGVDADYNDDYFTITAVPMYGGSPPNKSNNDCIPCQQAVLETQEGLPAQQVCPTTDGGISPGSGTYTLPMGGLSSGGQDGNNFTPVLTNGPTLSSLDLGAGISVPQAPLAYYTNTGIDIASGTTMQAFNLVGGSYQSTNFYQDNLVDNNSTHVLTLTQSDGTVLTFNDFDLSLAPALRGTFLSKVDPAGNTTSVTAYNASNQISEIQSVDPTGITESYLFTYNVSGTISNATLRRKAGAGAFATVRSVDYAYYDGTDGNGSAGDLKTATTNDASGNAIDTAYYRWYTTSSATGYQHALKFSLDDASYARAAAVYTDPNTATDAQLAVYADHYFEYDSQHRVTRHDVQGEGCSSCTGGLGSYTYTYASSSNSPGYNSWSNKMTETLPDGNENVYYTNDVGQVMLQVFVDNSDASLSGDMWGTFYEYDGSGRLSLEAQPAAVALPSSLSTIEAYSDLLNNVSGNYQYLADSAGPITTFQYASTTSVGISDTAAGDVAGYLMATSLQLGETGTPITQEAMDYYSHTGGGATVNPVADDAVYGDTAGLDVRATTYTYTWFSGSTQMESMTSSAPVVSSGQNGPGSADTQTTFFDIYGRPTWTKDGDGFITYTAYDPASGAVVKSISDVNTADTGDFSNLPSGWTTPSGGGLELITSYTVDSLGRDTEMTDPNGNVTYTVYNDAAHEVRTYPGFVSGATTGPIQISRAFWPAAGSGDAYYTESITSSATPSLTGGVPDGTESLSAGNIQSLSRDFTNSAGQVLWSDAYATLSGQTYSQAVSFSGGVPVDIGTSGTNFYRTVDAYDHRGRLEKVVSPTGTITRTVYDGLGRVVSQYVGTDDTPASGFWSPSNNTSPSNMMDVADYVYDGGGVGDGDLTNVTQHAGGSAPDRVTDYAYDWRDRQVSEKDGHQSTESTSDNSHPIFYTVYDNLGEVTEQDQYDGDNVQLSTLGSSGGVPVAPSSSLLRAETVNSYDDQGRVYLTQQYSVDQGETGGTAGTVGSSLNSNTFYDHRGNVVATYAPGGLATKDVYDGAGRLIEESTTDGGQLDSAAMNWTNANSLSTDVVLSQTIYTLDSDGNAILTADKERFDNDSTSGYGDLGTETTGNLARVYYMAAYYDAANRQTNSVNVGNNAASTYTRPGTVPTRSDTALVTSFGYDAAGNQATATDPRGIVNQTYFDMLGRTTQTIAAYDGGSPTNSTNQTTNYTYDGDNNVLTESAVVPAISAISAATESGSTVTITTTAAHGYTVGQTVTVAGVGVAGYNGTFTIASVPSATKFTYADTTGLTSSSGGSSKVIDSQTTAYIYGVGGTVGTNLFSNDLIATMEYPDKATGAASASAANDVSYTYNLLGQQTTMKDQNGTTHTYSYDVLGRLTLDSIAVASGNPQGVDTSVQSIGHSFDTGGRPYQDTSYASAGGTGTVVNQIQYAYDGFGQEVKEYQGTSGAVNTSTTLFIGYNYTENASGVNNDRLVSMSYPNLRLLDYNYNSGLDSDISRVSSLMDDSGTSGGVDLEEYTYLGLDTIVAMNRPEDHTRLTYIAVSGDTHGLNDGNDRYTGLDRFGRVDDQYWLDTTSGAGANAVDRFQYAYDRDGNQLYQNNLGPAGTSTSGLPSTTAAKFSELYHANSSVSGDNNTGYDALDRLTAMRRGTLSSSGNNGTTLDKVATLNTVATGDNKAWTLDAVGGWNSVTTDATTTAQVTNGQNETTTAGGVSTLTYDNNGNLTKNVQGYVLKYDGWNRLVFSDQGTNTTLHYDALGRWVKEDISGSANYLYYAGQGLIEVDASNVYNQYVRGLAYSNEIILRDRNTDHSITTGNYGGNGSAHSGMDERIYEQQDANWNTTSLYQVSGSLTNRIIERMAYDPYGAQQWLTAAWAATGDTSIFWRPLFQGEYELSEANVYIMGARDFDYTIGAWNQKDPIGYGDGMNDYQGFGSSPVQDLDPQGTASVRLQLKPFTVTNPDLGKVATAPVDIDYTEDCAAGTLTINGTKYGGGTKNVPSANGITFMGKPNDALPRVPTDGEVRDNYETDISYQNVQVSVEVTYGVEWLVVPGGPRSAGSPRFRIQARYVVTATETSTVFQGIYHRFTGWAKSLPGSKLDPRQITRQGLWVSTEFGGDCCTLQGPADKLGKGWFDTAIPPTPTTQPSTPPVVPPTKPGGAGK